MLLPRCPTGSDSVVMLYAIALSDANWALSNSVIYGLGIYFIYQPLPTRLSFLNTYGNH